MRSDDDLVTPLVDRRPHRLDRRVTACGTFAVDARDRKHRGSHTNFYPTTQIRDPTQLRPEVCASCTQLVGAEIRTIAQVLELIAPSPPRAA